MLLHTLFEEKLNRHPEGAVSFAGTTLSYTRLNEKANALAHLLIARGIGIGQPVGIFLDRSVDMVIALLAVLKSGGCYVPVEPGFPQERSEYILQDSQAVLVISSSGYRGVLQHDNILFIDETDTKRFPVTNPRLAVPDTSLSYIIYTSGTTGKPKGTMIEHRNVVEVLTNSSLVYDFKPSDSWTCVHSVCFDFSVWEIFGGLTYGKEVVIVPRQVIKNVVSFVELLKQGATILSLTPTAFNSMMDYLVNEEEAIHFALRYVILGGEAVSPARFSQWNKKFPQIKIINGYGVTETAIFFSFKEITPELIESNSSNIGVPIPGLHNHIVDTNMKPVAEGEAGELYIGGKAVGRGYINQPALHAKHFVPDIFSGDGMLYRTGDMVKRLPGNEMEYIGRIDNQVKIRGYRIELGEIEKNIYGYGGIKNTVVTVYKSPSEELYLTTYIVCDKDDDGKSLQLANNISEQSLKEYLAGKLPEYMIPYYVVFLDDMPMTNSGKADKSKLPSPQQALADNIVTARTEAEKLMTGIWSEVLGVEKETIGVDSSFFDLGGHSLLLTRLSAEVFYRFGVRIPIEELFSDPTVEKLAVHLPQTAPVQQAAEQNNTVTAESDAEVSLAQKVMFLSHKLNPKEAFPNSAISYEIIGDINTQRLEEAFRKVIQNNEGLRTVFLMEKGKIYSRICTDFDFAVQTVISSRAEIDEEIMALTRPFNFGKCPLIRVFCIETISGRKFLYVDMPHINSDGVTLENIISEMTAYYNGQTATPKMQFSDFKQYFDSYLVSEQYMSDQLYWQEHFDTAIPVLPFKKAAVGGLSSDLSGVSLVLEFPPALSARINKYLREKSITKFQFLLAAYFLFIRKITGEEDISVMIPLQNRLVKGFEKIIGLLANRSVVRLNVKNDKTIATFITECKASVLQAVHHAAYPFEMVFDEHRKNNGAPYRKPLYQTFFNYHNHQPQSRLGDAILKLHIHNKAKEILPLSVDIFDSGADYIIRILSKSGVYSKQELQDLTTGYFNLMEMMLTNDEASVQILFNEAAAAQPAYA